MGNFNNRLKCFIKYTSAGKWIQGSGFRGKHSPKSGRWVEVDCDLCCPPSTSTTSTTTTSSTSTTTTTL